MDELISFISSWRHQVSKRYKQKHWSEAYLNSCQTFKIKHFVNINNNFQLLTIFAKCSILDVWHDPQYVSPDDFKTNKL